MSSPTTLAALLGRALLLVGLLAAPWAAGAQRAAVDLELVLAVDVSGSVDEEEARLQRTGYVAAFRHPEVMAAIRSGLLRRIAVTYFEWAGPQYQKLVADWMVVEDEASANRLADRLADAPIGTAAWTSISGAIDFGMRLLASGAYEGTRRVIDISGDGANNQGLPVSDLRDRAVAAGIVINGLPIVNNKPSRFGFPADPDLDLYFTHCVIGGPGAFIVVAEDFNAFAAAIRRKLVMEIAAQPPGARIVPASATAYAPGCDIGERRFQQYFRGRGIDMQ